MPAINQFPYFIPVRRIGSMHKQVRSLELYLFGRGFPYLQPILTAKVPMRLTADILTRRFTRFVSAKTYELLEYPASTFGNFRLNRFAACARGRGDNDSPVRMHGDFKGSSLPIDRCIRELCFAVGYADCCRHSNRRDCASLRDCSIIPSIASTLKATPRRPLISSYR